jgi:large subunit ribosomal protein L21
MSEYAIIRSGNKQYRVKAGDVIDLELIDAEAKGPFQSKEILLFSDGKKTIIDASGLAKVFVKGEVIGEVRGPKVLAYKYKKRKNYRRKVGHRQNYTRVKITGMGVN